MEKKNSICLLAVVSLLLILSGCAVKTYPLTQDRVDQDLVSGNRGYLEGQPSGGWKEGEKKTTRTVHVLEIEMGSRKEAKKTSRTAPSLGTEEKITTESYAPEVTQPVVTTTSLNMEKYKVQKGDTLQKISKKFYGTTKKWKKIYDANKDILKGPDKVYPGQTINIPVESLKETKENLK